MEIVLAGEVSDGDEGVAQEETLPPKPKKVERKVETTEIAKDSENTVLDPVAEDEEVEITFECETGDDVAEE
ncbi:MAG: hypothetical protein LBO09_03075 [Candidatus Peribacteria bacterium]|jgi:hypothetical protein|nr:hypothetical protein [Candidatus Peribacteria bacterium]